MSEDSPTSLAIPQPLLDRLAPDYRAFVEGQPPAMRIPLHTIQWTSAFRQPVAPPPDLGQADPVPVGSTRTIKLGNFSVLILTPEGERPSKGWPVFLYIHGGGWVFGTVETGRPFYSRACVGELDIASPCLR
jgi:acetyl esterase/lipase